MTHNRCGMAGDTSLGDPAAPLQNMDGMLPVLVPTSSVLGPENRRVSPPQPHGHRGCRTRALAGGFGEHGEGRQLFHACRGTGRRFPEPTLQLTTDLAPSHNIDFFFFHNSPKKSPSPEL